MEPLVTPAAPWPFAQKVIFRFFVIFFFLYILFNPNGIVPILGNIYDLYIQPMHSLMVWSAAHILHLSQPVTVFTNGSGDTTYDYLVLLFCIITGAVGAALWSLIKPGTCNYDKLYYWLTVVVRFCVGITMITYGSVKVVKLQFPDPGIIRLLQPYGNSSPMGLAWTFMGLSKGYNYFTGIAELSCGILLLFRKTTTLGALIGLVVSANIMAINYCFDIPVKIFSTMLVVMTLFLLSKDFDRFISFFFLNRVTQPARLAPRQFKNRWKNAVLLALKFLLITYVALSIGLSSYNALKTYHSAPKPALYGLYDVQTFIRNGDTIAPLITDTIRWRRLNIDAYGNARIYLMNDSIRTYQTINDTTVKSLMFYLQNSSKNHMMYYSNIKPDELLLKGGFNSYSVQIKLRKVDEKNFLLIKRGFHWINEYPFNR